LTVIAAPALSSARTLCSNGPRPHLLHAGQHDSDDRANPCLPPMNQFGLVASPMKAAFVKGDAPEEKLQAVDARQEPGPLDEGVTPSAASQRAALGSRRSGRLGLQKKAEIRRQADRPDAEDPDTVNHLNWYLSTGLATLFPERARFARRASSTTRHPPPLTWTT